MVFLTIFNFGSCKRGTLYSINVLNIKATLLENYILIKTCLSNKTNFAITFDHTWPKPLDMVELSLLRTKTMGRQKIHQYRKSSRKRSLLMHIIVIKKKLKTNEKIKISKLNYSLKSFEEILRWFSMHSRSLSSVMASLCSTMETVWNGLSSFVLEMSISKSVY